MAARKAEISKDTAFQEQMQLGIKSYLYSAARSNALNGITENTKINYVLTWWQKAIIGTEIATGILTLAFLALTFAGGKRKNNTKG
jgi:hypothetical protein